MSLRFDRINNFWFVLRHEIEHVLNKDGLAGFVLDVELSELLSRQDEDTPEEERRANYAAEEFLVPGKEFDRFIVNTRPFYSNTKVAGFAESIGVHPGIVVGQLQNREELPYTHFHRHLAKFRHIITEAALTDGWGNAPTQHA